MEACHYYYGRPEEAGASPFPVALDGRGVVAFPFVVVACCCLEEEGNYCWVLLLRVVEAFHRSLDSCSSSSCDRVFVDFVWFYRGCLVCVGLDGDVGCWIWLLRGEAMN